MKSYLWRILVSLILLLFLFRWVNRAELLQLLKHFSLPYFFAYGLISLLDRWVMAYKWKILLDAQKIKVSLGELTVIYFKGSFVGGLLPTSLGGDAVRAYEIVKKQGALLEDGLSSIIMERFLGFLSSALLALLMIPLVAYRIPRFPTSILLLLVVLLAGGIFFLVLWIRGGLPPSLHRWLTRWPAGQKLSKIADSFGRFKNHPGVLVRFFVWSMFEQLLPVAALYFLSYAIGLAIPPLLLLPLLPLTQFFARIPISLSGFGLQEGLFMSFFPLINLSPTSSFLLGLASNLGNIIFSLPGAYFYLFGSRDRKPGPGISG